MRTLVFVVALAAVLGVSAQERAAAPARTVSDFFRDFTAEWIRANPNQAAATRYFSGAEQDRFEQQLTPETRRVPARSRRCSRRRAWPSWRRSIARG